MSYRQTPYGDSVQALMGGLIRAPQRDHIDLISGAGRSSGGPLGARLADREASMCDQAQPCVCARRGALTIRAHHAALAKSTRSPSG
jgi:hypothetical protein